MAFGRIAVLSAPPNSVRKVRKLAANTYANSRAKNYCFTFIKRILFFLVFFLFFCFFFITFQFVVSIVSIYTSLCLDFFTGNLKAHILRVHNAAEGEPTYACSYCSCVFKKLGSLNGHIKRVHTNVLEVDI